MSILMDALKQQSALPTQTADSSVFWRRLALVLALLVALLAGALLAYWLQPAQRACGQEARSARTRQAIYDAAVRALDEHGYAETSVMKVQALAGVSRGALTHQFPTKEDLIVAVAERLLDEVRHSPSPKTGPRPVGEDGYLEWLLWFAWSRFVDTPKGRALCEIFQAMRTDGSLSGRLAAPAPEPCWRCDPRPRRPTWRGRRPAPGPSSPCLPGSARRR